MLTLSKKQLDAVEALSRRRLLVRIRAHWAERHPRSATCFSDEELTFIVERVLELATAKPHLPSEADVALAADLWLHELSRRRHIARP